MRACFRHLNSEELFLLLRFLPISFLVFFFLLSFDLFKTDSSGSFDWLVSLCASLFSTKKRQERTAEEKKDSKERSQSEQWTFEDRLVWWPFHLEFFFFFFLILHCLLQLDRVRFYSNLFVCAVLCVGWQTDSKECSSIRVRKPYPTSWLTLSIIQGRKGEGTRRLSVQDNRKKNFWY